MKYLFLAHKMTGGEVKEGKEGKERPALPVAGYEPPSWAGKAAPGLHLDVLKVLTISSNIIRFELFMVLRTRMEN